MKALDKLFEDYFSDWLPLCPSASKIHSSLHNKGETIVNDHIALRTLQSSDFGVETLAKPFIDLGFDFSGDYTFREKKLRARHLEHPNYPVKVFISELEFSKVSDQVTKQCESMLNALRQEKSSKSNLGLMGRSWKFSKQVYEQLYRESEYAAWFYAFGLRANHFTISVNDLKYFKSIPDLNAWLKSEGFNLNSSGGEIKGTPSDFLVQSSTMSDEVGVKDDFTGEICKVPGCYIEFAQRFKDKSGKLYSGFIEKSADKIFESTSKK